MKLNRSVQQQTSFQTSGQRKCSRLAMLALSLLIAFTVTGFANDAGAGGSVLVFNIYTSKATMPQAENTLVSIVNTGSKSIGVLLYFVRANCTEKAEPVWLFLNPNQAKSFQAVDIDPDSSGYIIAVAVDPQTGIPVNHNFLMGDEYVKFASGYAGHLEAVQFTALFKGNLSVQDGLAKLAFDGEVYSQAPRELAICAPFDRASGNQTMLILNPLNGNLAQNSPTIRSIYGELFNDEEESAVFTFAMSGCQFRSVFSNSFPRVPHGFDSMTGSGRASWIRIKSFNYMGLVGAVLSMNPNSAANSNAFSGTHNLHAMSQAASSTVIVPIPPPGI